MSTEGRVLFFGLNSANLIHREYWPVIGLFTGLQSVRGKTRDEMLWRRGSEIGLGSCCAYAYSFDTCLVNSAVHKLSVSIRIRYPPASGSQTNKKQNKREVTDAKAAGLIVGQNPMKYSIVLLLTASKIIDPLRSPYLGILYKTKYISYPLFFVEFCRIAQRAALLQLLSVFFKRTKLIFLLRCRLFVKIDVNNPLKGFQYRGLSFSFRVEADCSTKCKIKTSRSRFAFLLRPCSRCLCRNTRLE